MAISPKHLVVKTSTIPGSGKGLFTRKFIAAGTRILEYTGRVSTWKDANHVDGENAYIYYVTRNHVIDALADKKSLARYANDAKGLTKVKGIINNCEYVEENRRVFIHAKKDIPAGAEILVPYGPEYWGVIRHNIKVAKEDAKAAKKKKTSSRNTGSKKSAVTDRNKKNKPAGKTKPAGRSTGKTKTAGKSTGKTKPV